MTRPSPKSKLLFSFGFILLVLLALTPVSKGDDDNNDAVSSPENSEIICNCPLPDTSKEDLLQQNLDIQETELKFCNSKSAEFRNDLIARQIDLDSCNTKYVSLESDSSSHRQETQLRIAYLEEQESKLKSDLSSLRDQYLQLETYSSDHRKKSDLQITHLEKQESKLKSDLSSLRNEVIQRKQCEESLSICNTGLTSSRDGIKECHDNLSESWSGHNKTLQSQMSLEKKLTKAESLHEKKVKFLRSEVSSKTTELEKSKRAVKMYQDKNLKQRDEIRRLERELKDMHRSAVSTYVNTTNVKQDLWRFTSRNAAVTYGFCEEQVSTFLSLPEVDFVQEKILVLYHKGSHHLANAMRYVTPIVNVCRESQIWKKYGAVVYSKGVEMITSVSLSLSSALELVSTVALDYLDLIHDESSEVPFINRKIIEVLSFIKTYSESVARWSIVIMSTLLIMPSSFYRALVFLFFLPLRPFVLLLQYLRREKSSYHY